MNESFIKKVFLRMTRAASAPVPAAPASKEEKNSKEAIAPPLKAERESSRLKSKIARKNKTSKSTRAPTSSKKTEEKKPVRSSARRLYRLGKRIWVLSLLCLPLDFFALALNSRLPHTETLEAMLLIVSAACFALALVFLQKSILLSFVSAVQTIQRGGLKFLKENPSAIYLLFIPLVLFEGVLRTQGKLRALLPVLIIAILAFPKIKAAFASHVALIKDEAESNQQLIERADNQLFAASITPLIFVHIALVSSILYYSAFDYSEFSLALATLTAGVLLFALEPRREEFFMLCPECSREVSRAFTSLGHCDACSPRQKIGDMTFKKETFLTRFSRDWQKTTEQMQKKLRELKTSTTKAFGIEKAPETKKKGYLPDKANTRSKKPLFEVRTSFFSTRDGSGDSPPSKSGNSTRPREIR